MIKYVKANLINSEEVIANIEELLASADKLYTNIMSACDTVLDSVSEDIIPDDINDTANFLMKAMDHLTACEAWLSKAKNRVRM